MTKAIHQEFVASLQKNIQVCVCVTATDCYCAMLLTAVKTYVQSGATATAKCNFRLITPLLCLR